MLNRALGLALLLTSLGTAASAVAASLTLTPEEIGEAIRVGEQSVVLEAFGMEWQVPGPSGQSLTVLTAFHRVAVAARNAAFKNELLSRGEAESIARKQQGRLAFWARLRGERLDFARWFQPVLLLPGGKEIRAAFVQNEHTARRPEEEGQYTARCLYSFPTDELSPKSRVVLVIRDADRRDVARFTVDLATMR